MTAIADILVNPKLSELQLSNSNQKSQISSSSVSFQDYLASFNPEEKNSVSQSAPKNDEYLKKSENVHSENESNKVSDGEVKNRAEDKKVENKSEEKNTNQTQGNEKSENQDAKVAEKIESENTETETSVKGEEKKLVKAENFEKTENSQINIEETSDLEKLLSGQKLVKTEEKKEIQSEVDKDVQKKSLKSDFARLDELFIASEIKTEELLPAEINAAELQVTEIADALKTKGTDLDEKETEGTDLLASVKSSNEKNDFILERNVENTNPRISKLDKDGKITVEDYRTEIPQQKESLKDNKAELKTQVSYDSNNSATITMELAQNAEMDVRSLNSQTAASDGSNFQAMLNNQIQNNAAEFVKAGSIVLKDNDKGTINLVIRPDELGNVKIHLSMDGKTVNGHITVNSKEALQVFKDNAETLREAFIKNGFDAANFDVAYNNNSSGQNQDFNQQFSDSSFVGKKTYSGMEGGDAVSDGNYFEENENFSKYSVNIVA